MSTPLIVIVGLTASGKTDLALNIARRYEGEIVSADSWLVRRQLDIGTSKPSLKSQHMIPHHLIDIIDPCADFSAAEYKRLALEAISNISSRGKLPILVGGTGLYIDAILYDYSFLGAADPKIRRHLNSLTLAELLSLASKKGLDLSTIDVRNKRRVIRLIESEGGNATKSKLRNNTLIIGLTRSTKNQALAVSKRVELMISQGLEQEVRQLSEQYGWNCEGLKGIGYSEWQSYFSGQQSLDVTKSRIIKDTIELAKRQRTWFKRNKSIHWYATPLNIAKVDALITTFLNKYITV